MPKVHLRFLLEVLPEKLKHPPRGYESQLPVAITQPFMSNAHIKTYVMLISGRNTSRYSLNIDIDGVKIPHIRSAKYLGVVIDSELKWTDHINELSSRLSSRLYILRKLRKISPTTISTVFTMLYSNLV